MRKIYLLFPIIIALWFVLPVSHAQAGCAAHTYTVGTGKDYPGATGVADAIAAVKAACGWLVPFSGTQTVSVYATGGPYTAVPGDTYTLATTASYPLIITAAPGESPVFNCGGASRVIDISSSYTTFTGFEITACGSVYSEGGTNITVSYNYLHDMTGEGAIWSNGTMANGWIHHNRVVNAPVGITWGGNALIEYNEVGPTTGGSATQIGCGSEGVSCTIRNNIVYGAGAQGGSSIWNYTAATLTGNVSYYNRYGFVAETTTSGDTVTASHNIVAYPATQGCHCEGGSGACWMNVDHGLCLKSQETYPVSFGSSAASSLSLTSSIVWADSIISVNTKNLSLGNLSSLYSDYNIFTKTGTPLTAIDSSIPTLYATLSDWQTTGQDTHTNCVNGTCTSDSVDPHFVGDVNLLNTSARVFPECPTIECRLAKIQHNYTPTNLALKGAGCAWNGTSCVPDHSDIGPVPVTIYDAPGITGGGAY